MKNKTILIVDDTVANLDVLSELLNNYDTINTISGIDALKIANEKKVDLILLDIVMPNMNGYEVCKKLKSNPKTKHIPVVFITSKTDDESIKQAFDVGGVDYITKPFMTKELLIRVKTQLYLSQVKIIEKQRVAKLKNKVFFTQSELCIAQSIAKIGFWQYNILSEKFSIDDEFYNIVELNKKDNPIDTFEQFLETIKISKDFHFLPSCDGMDCTTSCVKIQKFTTLKGNTKYIANRCNATFNEDGVLPLLITGVLHVIQQTQQMLFGK